MKRIILNIAVILCCIQCMAQDYSQQKLDSLYKVYASLSDSDTNKMWICNDIADNHYNWDSIYAYADRLMKLATFNDNDLFKGYALYHMGYCEYLDGKYEIANKYYFQARSFMEAKGFAPGVADCNKAIGKNYAYLGNFPLSEEYYYKVLDHYKQQKDSSRIAVVYSMIANNYTDQRMWAKAEELYLEAYRLDSLAGDEHEMAYVQTDLGDMYLLEYLMSQAENNVELINKARLRFFDAMALYYDEPFSKYSICFSLSFVLYYDALLNNYQGQKLEDLIMALEMFYSDGKDAVEEMDMESETVLFDMCKVNMLILKNQKPEAKQLLDSLADIIYNSDGRMDDKLLYLYTTFDNYYQSVGDYRQAYLYKSRFYERVNSVSSIDYAVQSTQRLTANKYEDEIEERKASEANMKRNILLIGLGVLLLAGFGLWEYTRKRRHNQILCGKNAQLLMQKEEILAQKEEIQTQSDELAERNEQITKKNKQITDSINYASLIQKAALPTDETLHELFGDYFLIYRPLNIVAGDFYWASQAGRYRILVCADCTGHGVPGAFVSMLGVSLLNELSANMAAPDVRVEDILNELRAKLMKALGQSKVKYENGAVYSMDGMDLSMVMIDYDNMTLQYGGAYRPLWIWRNGEIIQHKPDKMPIGLYLGPVKNFSGHDIEIQKGDMLYMFSDGIPDQFGYIDDSRTVCKHFSSKRLLAMLAELGGRSTDEQKTAIENAVDAWKNGYKQLDDNIFIGVRV